VATRADFEESYLLSGPRVETDIRAPNPRATATLIGFAEA
jgi:hypothetical protein